MRHPDGPFLSGAVVAGALALLLAATARAPQGIPVDLWDLLVPPENPVTSEKVALGRKLYYDLRLSKDGSVACATCHKPAKGFSDGKKVAEGVGGAKGTRNSPTILNAVTHVPLDLVSGQHPEEHVSPHVAFGATVNRSDR